MPKFAIDIPYVFGGGLNTPGTLQLLALCLLFGGLALSYDLLFGFTGLLSFGHALYFAVGVYVAAIAMTRWHWSFWQAVLFTALVGFVLAVVLGAVSLRVGGIAFAMVTLAFAQAGSILVLKNPYGWTGGEEGFGVDYLQLPAWAVGILNTKYLYWLALGYAAAVFAIVRWAVNSSPGHVWQAIRENELRVAGARAEAVHLQADVVRARVDARDGRRHHLPAAARRCEHAGDDRELHADAAADGRARRNRLALGRDDRRHPLHLRRPPARRSLVGSSAVSTLPSVLPDAAATAALHPRRAVHPRRVLRSRRADADRAGRGPPGQDPAKARRARGDS